MRSLVAFAEERALRIAALGSASRARALFEQAGLRALYLGDEAIVDTERSASTDGAFERSGSRSRGCEKAGYRTAHRGARLARRPVVARLEQIANDWRRGAPERGFSMAMDSLRNPAVRRSARRLRRRRSRCDPRLPPLRADLRARRRLALVHAPQHETPNGLTEFLIVEAIEHLRARGVGEVSLNFAAFARLIREPRGLLERTWAGSRARRHVVPDRAALPLQRQVLPALGAALLHVRAPLRSAAGGYRCALARGAAAEAEAPPARPAAGV